MTDELTQRLRFSTGPRSDLQSDGHCFRAEHCRRDTTGNCPLCHIPKLKLHLTTSESVKDDLERQRRKRQRIYD